MMANPMYGQNKYDDDAQIAANVANVWKPTIVDSGWSAECAVTADTGVTVTVSQPDKSVLLDLYVILSGTWTTHATNDLDFDLGSAAKGGQYIDEKAIYDNAGASVTLVANSPIPIIVNGLAAGASEYQYTSTGYASEAMALASSLVNVSGAARTLHASLIPKTGALVAATDAKFKVVAVFGDNDMNA